MSLLTLFSPMFSLNGLQATNHWKERMYYNEEWHKGRNFGVSQETLLFHNIYWAHASSKKDSHTFIFYFFSVFKKFLMFIYFWGRGREWAGDGQREETQNPKQAPGSERSAQSTMRGSNPQTARSQPELKLDAQPIEPPRCPSRTFLISPNLPPLKSM